MAEKMADETTPLIQTVQVAPPRQRYSHHRVRKFCTVSALTVLVVGFATITWFDTITSFFKSGLHGQHGRYSETRTATSRLSFEDVQSIFMDTPSADRAREWSKYYTSGPHLAGKNLSQAEWTRDRWTEWGLDASIAAYDVYINYPEDHSLSLLHKPKGADAWEVTFKASLTEDVLEEDSTSGLDNRIPTFHGYAASGNVTAPIVFVNYGTYADFEDLIKAGIPLKGKIAIAKYGNNFRGLKVKRAQELGMVGILIYSDPGDDGKFTEENGYKAYPDGPARHPSAVQRGSVQFLSSRPGDPTTPGYPSKPGVPRSSGEDSMPKIPSLPISYSDAIPILKALNGHGPKSKDLGKWWTKNQGLLYKGVDYDIGPTPDDVVVNLYNKQEYVTTPQWDVIGIVNGTIPDEVIIVGNHRDAWIAGGAGDPNSGSAVINEVIRSVGEALKQGWKPLRTIVFASWDGEEYGLVGSTEWVEEYLPWLSKANLAYLNADVGVEGPHLRVSAAPVLNQLIRDVTHLIPSPNQTVAGQTVGDVWNGYIGNMGSGSDFTAFQDYAGVSSLDIGFRNSDLGIYQYHSNYDSFHWMEKFGDPGFAYHRTMAQLLGMLTITLSETLVVPFNATEYAESLINYLDRITTKLIDDEVPLSEHDMAFIRASATSNNVTGSEDLLRHSLGELRAAMVDAKVVFTKYDQLARWANEEYEQGIPWWNVVKKAKVAAATRLVNTFYQKLDRNFLYQGGLDGRHWFKHVVFAPGLWTGYAGALYPGLQEAIDAKDYVNGVRWAGIIEKCVRNAAK